LCVLLFLWSGFTPWSLTFGVMLGFPFLLTAVILYVIAVARDLQRHGLNRTTRHGYTQAASCEIASGEVSAARSVWTAAVTSGV
jgi:hypothetical protein